MALISYLTTIRFGWGAVRDIADDIAGLGIERPLIVTDRGIVAAGLLNVLLESIPTRISHSIFSDTPSNPTEKAVTEALQIYRDARCDALIAFGGGSPIDLAKAVALLATHEPPLSQYALIDGGLARIGANIAPVIAVPTTAGTGSEVGRAALINLSDGRKVGLISPHLIPQRAICDAELTVGMPPLLTAATGMDALSHCIETFLSPRFNPPADAIALDGASRIIRNLPRVVADGADQEARTELMMGALEGGLTFQKGLGAVHGLSHALGSLPGLSLHHGTLNAVLLPPVLRFNELFAAGKYPRLRSALGLAPDTDLANYFATLNVRLGLPSSLKDMKVTASVIDQVAATAEKDHSTATNPRPCSAADYAEMLRGSLA